MKVDVRRGCHSWRRSSGNSGCWHTRDSSALNQLVPTESWRQRQIRDAARRGDKYDWALRNGTDPTTSCRNCRVTG